MKRQAIWAAALLIPAALMILGAAHGAPRPEYAPSTEQNAWLNPNTVFHPDEFAYVGIPYRMLLHHDWNPHYYHNPPLNLYTNLGFAWLINADTLPHRADYGDREIAPFALYFSARYLSALYSLLTIALTYAIGRAAFDRRAGLIAAALIGLSPLTVQHAHYATPNAQTTLIATAAFGWAGLLVLRRLPRALPLWIQGGIGGLLVGLTMAARYNAVTVGVVSGLAILTVSGQQRRILPVLIAGVAVSLGLALGAPGIVLAPQEVLDQIRDILNWYAERGGGPGFTADRGLEAIAVHWRYVTLAAVGPVGILAAGGGLILTLRARRIRWQTAWLGSVMALYLLVYTLLALRGRRVQANLLFPLLLPLALLAGYALVRAWDRWPRRRIKAISLLLLLGWPALTAAWFTVLISTPDNRLRAQAWVYDHVPRGTNIYLLGPYNVPLDPLDYPTRQTYGGEASPDQVRRAAELIIVYSGSSAATALREPALGDPAARARETAIRQVLNNDWIAIKRFARQPWPFAHLTPDDVSYWHQMEIVIYCKPSACPVENAKGDR